MDAFALSLRYKTDGFDQAIRQLDQIDERGKRVSSTHDKAGASVERIGHKAAGVGIALAGMSEVGVSAMEKIVHTATNVAFSFGTAGPIVAAAGVAAIAIVNIFERAQKEMEATDKRARDLLRSLTLDTGVTTASQLFSGDPFAKGGSPEQLGIQAARARAEALRRQIASSESRQTGGRGTQMDTAAAREERENLLEWLQQAEPLYARVTKRVNELAAAEVERNQYAIKTAAEEQARQDRVKAAHDAESLFWVRLKGTIDDVHGTLKDLGDYVMRGVTVPDPGKMLEAGMQAGVQQSLKGLPVGAGIASAGMEPQDVENTPLMFAFRQHAEAMAERAREIVANTFGDAIQDGFTAAFSGKGLGGAFKSLGGSVLRGLGGIFVDMGKKLLVYGATMSGLLPALSNPFTSGPAAIAAGVALIALGAGMAAIASRGEGDTAGGGGGGGAWTAAGASRDSDYTKIRLYSGYGATGSQVGAGGMYVFAPTIIGQDDPKAQRELVEMVDKGRRRG